MNKVAVPDGGFRNIAVLRLSSLGDVVLTLPVVHALHAAWPDARIHDWVMEEYADVLRADPAIAHVRALERDASRLEDLVSMSAELEDCDLIVDLHASVRTACSRSGRRAVAARAQPAAAARALGARALDGAGAAAARDRATPRRWRRSGSRPRPSRVTVAQAAEDWARAQLTSLGAAGAPSWRCARVPGTRPSAGRRSAGALDELLARDGRARIVLSTAAEQRAPPARGASRATTSGSAGSRSAWTAGPRCWGSRGSRSRTTRA